MQQFLSTTVSPTQRTISILLSSGETERYALAETTGGDIFWRQDTFTAEVWTAHGGRRTVGEILARVPDCAQHIVRWTREEIELGPAVAEGDVFVRAIRAEALRRLAAELDAALPAAA